MTDGDGSDENDSLRLLNLRGGVSFVLFIDVRNLMKRIVTAHHHRDILRDKQLVALLKLMIANDAELSAITEYPESGLSVLSRFGRFDAVMVLLDAP